MTVQVTGRRVWWLTLACLIPALPLLVAEVPPLGDYPNHLARLWYLGTQTADPDMVRMLAPQWALLPNLGADAILPWLIRLVPVHIAGRLLLAAILALPVLGAAALSRATFGTRSAWSLGAALVTCNALFLLGFLNFGLSTGLAMLAAAGWYRWRETRPRATLLLALVAASLLFFCHLAGVVFFLILIGACEAERCWNARHADPWSSIVRRGLAFLMIAAVPAALYAATALSDTGGVVIYADLSRKEMLALYPLLNYDLRLDIGTAAAIMGVLVLGAVTGRLEVPVRSRLTIGALLALFLVSPEILKGLAYIDSRFAVMLGFTLFAGVRPVRLPRGVATAVFGAGALLLTARTGVVGAAWHEYNAEVADVRAAIQPIEPGARVLPMWVHPGGRPPGGPASPRYLADGTMMDWHLPAFVMLDQKAFWPYIFANPSQQPMRLRGEYRRLALDFTAAASAALVAKVLLSEADKQDFPQWASWSSRFDYVLLIQEGGPPVDVAGFGQDRLSLVRATPLAALFRVTGKAKVAGVP